MEIDNGTMFILTAAFVLSIVVELWFVRKTMILSGPEKRKEDAILNGRVTQGRLKDVMSVNSKDENNKYYLATYVYQVNGKEYEISGVRSECRPYKTIEIYYDKNPAKSFVQGGVSSLMQIPLVIIPFAVVYLLARLLLK